MADAVQSIVKTGLGQTAKSARKRFKSAPRVTPDIRTLRYGARPARVSYSENELSPSVFVGEVAFLCLQADLDDEQVDVRVRVIDQAVRPIGRV